MNVIEGGEYRVDGQHLLSTPVNASSVALTPATKPIGQGASAIAIGVNAGLTNQSIDAVAIGSDAGKTTQAQNTVAIGKQAGETSQGQRAISMGYGAGNVSQGSEAIAIGYNAGVSAQGIDAIAIGSNCEATGNQPSKNVTIGANAHSAGFSNCITIGEGAIPGGTGELVLGSASTPLTTGAAGALNTYLSVRVNGTLYKVPLHL